MSDEAPIERPLVDGRITHAISQLRFRARRLDRRRLAAIALAVAAGLITRGALGRASAIEAGLGTRVPVVVATEPLFAGSIVGDEQVTIEMWPAALVPDGAYREFVTAAATITADIYAGEALTEARVNAANLGLALNEVAVTLPQPLARPPLELGYQVQLVGVVGDPADFLARATVLTTGRIVAISDDSLTVAVTTDSMARIIEHNAVGTVEIVVTPQRG